MSAKLPKGIYHLINPLVKRYLGLNLFEARRFEGLDAQSSASTGVDLSSEYSLDLLDELKQAYQDYLAHDRLTLPTQAGSGAYLEVCASLAEQFNTYLNEARFNDYSVTLTYDEGLATRVITVDPSFGGHSKHFTLGSCPSHSYFKTVMASGRGWQSFLAYSGEEFTRGIEKYATRQTGLIYIATPHSPLGYTLQPQQIERINRIAENKDCLLLLDTSYADYALNDDLWRRLALFDAQRSIIVSNIALRYGLYELPLLAMLSTRPELNQALHFANSAQATVPTALTLGFYRYLLAKHHQLPLRRAQCVKTRRSEFLCALNDRQQLLVPFSEADNALFMPFSITSKRISSIALVQHCLRMGQTKIMPSERFYPHHAAAYSNFTNAGRLNPQGGLPFLEASFVAESPLIYSPDFTIKRQSLVCTAFGADFNPQIAASRLADQVNAVHRLSDTH